MVGRCSCTRPTIQKIAKAFDHSIQTGVPYEGVMRLRRADGEFRWHHARCEPLRDRQDASFSGMACLLTSMKGRTPRICYAAAKPVWPKHRG